MVSKSESGIALPYEKAAMNGEEMPDNLSPPDQALFLGLKYLYAQWKLGIIDKATAVKEKRKLLGAYEVHRFWDQLGDSWAEALKATDLARAEYRKTRTLENADRLVAVLDGRKSP